MTANDETAARIQKVHRGLGRQKREALLVSAAANIRYLTGFSGSSCYLLVAPGWAVLYTDGRYEIQARQQTQDLEIVVAEQNVLVALAGDLKKRRVKRLAFEQNRLSFENFQFLRGHLRGCRLEPVVGLVEQLRSVKSAAEIERIRAAVRLNSRAFLAACRRLRPTWSEKRLAAEIDYQMCKLGAEKPAFDTIVAGGPRGALPHAQPSRLRLPPHGLIVIDQGAILDGYTSDMTRTICLGRPSRREREMFRAVCEAQAAAVAVVKAGVKARTVDRQARQVLRKFKLDKAFTHSTGHGLGLEIHEYPRIGPREDIRLSAGMVITIEPGVYLEDVGGVRIEDVVVVESDGCEVLTRTPKRLHLPR